MAQAKVTDFYAKRRSSRRTDSRPLKRRELSSSGDSLLKEAPLKKRRHEHVPALFEDIEDNCKPNSISIGKTISFHEFAKALESTSRTDDQLKSPAINGKKGGKQRGRKKQESKLNTVTMGTSKPPSTLEQYLEKKLDKGLNVASGREEEKQSDKGLNVASRREKEVVNSSKDNCQTPLEKTPTKRGHNQTREQVRRKKVKEIFNEESGYSSQSSPGDNQLNERSKTQAKRCLGSQFQHSQESEAFSIAATQSSISVGQAETEKEIIVQLNPQKVERRPAPMKAKNQNEGGNVTIKSPIKDRIRQTLADQVKRNSELSSQGPKKGTRKLSPEEVKAKLAKCGKLAELKAVLEKVKSSTQVTKEVVIQQDKKPEPLPAYKKYHYLAVAAPPTLALPLKYKTLEEMFLGTDTVVSMLHNRLEECPFSKLKSGVHELCRKTFQMRNLGQIKTIYPASYRLYQQKNFRPISKRGKDESGGYELMVEANLESFNGNSVSSDASTSSNSTMKDIYSQNSFLKKFTPSALITRRTIFHSNLIEIVKEQHKDFLQKQNPPLTVPSNKITRWHPKFPLEEVCDIDSSPLPQPPHVQTYSTAKDVLNKARDLMNPKVLKALELIANQNEDKSSKPAIKPTLKKTVESSKTKEVPSGISSDLLERIRAKEARNIQAAMIRSEVDEERIGMLERLPELCLIIRGLFLAEKKAALTVDVVIQKVGDSCKTLLTQGQLEKHIELIKEILPDWMTSIKIRKVTYLKINKKKELKDLTNQITKVLKEEKRK